MLEFAMGRMQWHTLDTLEASIGFCNGTRAVQLMHRMKPQWIVCSGMHSEHTRVHIPCTK